MTPRIIVSYDDTDNDRDAHRARAAALAVSGAELSLAYVRHQQADARDRESLEQRQAEELLANGAQRDRRARHARATSSSTLRRGEGLIELAEQRAAPTWSCSDPSTGPRPAPWSPAPRRSGFSAAAQPPSRSRRPTFAHTPSVRVVEDRYHRATATIAAEDTARSARRALSAPRSATSDAEQVDLLVIGSRDGTPGGTA